MSQSELSAEQHRQVELTRLGERSLPARYYTDPAVLEREKEQIFYRTWQYACHASQLNEPGKFVCIEIMDQIFFLISDEAGEVRAFYNVCPHRGHPLVAGSGAVRDRIVCPYHAWTYDLQGKLRNARHANSSKLIPVADICLNQVRLERLFDFFFVNLDKHAEPLESYAAELKHSIEEKIPDLSNYELEPALEYIGDPFECNWKVMLDNQLECYHCEVAHRSFSQVMHLPETINTIERNLVTQTIPTNTPNEDSPFPYNRHSDVTDGNFWTLFPNTVLARSPGSPVLSISRVEPLTPTRTARMIQVLSDPRADKDGDDKRMRWLRDGVIAEDRRLCEAVQRGMAQRGFTQGYYAVNNDHHDQCEEPVRFFHQRYLQALDA